MPAINTDNIKMIPVAKKSTASKKTASPAPAASPVTAPAPSPAPAPVAAPVVTPVPASPVAVEVAAAAPVEESVNTAFVALVEKFNGLRNSLNSLAPELKKMEKQVARLEKKAERRRRRKAGVDGEKKPNTTTVFTKPVKITDELCVFLGLAKGTEVSRSDVTRGLMKYAKERSLTEKQKIHPDQAMRKLLTLTEQDELTILNLQKYLKKHYIKAPVPVATA